MSKLDLKYVASLVDDARLQDSNAFASLFAITYEEQYKLSYSYLWDKALVLDTLLDIYLNALHSMRRLERSRDFVKWMNDMNIEACEILADAMDIIPPKGRPKIPPFPFEDAERLLEYVFIEEGRKPNTIPLATLVEYNEYRMQRYTLQRYLVFLVILSFVMAPVFFITPDFEVDIDKAATKQGQLKYIFDIDTFIPVDTAVASIGERNIPVLQNGEHSYYILPTTNGDMEITVNFANHRSVTKTVNVTGVDRRVPEIISSKIDSDMIHLYVKDDGSGVQWRKIYSIDANNAKMEPLSYNAIIGELVFAFQTDHLHVYIPDRSGNVLHAVINHKEVDK